MKSKRPVQRHRPARQRYSAKLLFQYRVLAGGGANKRRLCEERIITFLATHGRAALTEAKRRGGAAQHHYLNAAGQPVRFEFVGVMELLCLEAAAAADEVWYEMRERVRPRERRAQLIPPESQLHAIRNFE